MRECFLNIIHMERPRSSRIPMPRGNRAAQFSSFAALTGHRDAMDEIARYTDDKYVLSDDQIEIINDKLNNIINNIDKGILVNFVYFKKDKHKAGGSYMSIKSKVIKYIEDNRMLSLENGILLNIDDIYEIEFCDDP